MDKFGSSIMRTFGIKQMYKGSGLKVSDNIVLHLFIQPPDKNQMKRFLEKGISTKIPLLCYPFIGEVRFLPLGEKKT